MSLINILYWMLFLFVFRELVVYISKKHFLPCPTTKKRRRSGERKRGERTGKKGGKKKLLWEGRKVLRIKTIFKTGTREGQRETVLIPTITSWWGPSRSSCPLVMLIPETWLDKAFKQFPGLCCQASCSSWHLKLPSWLGLGEVWQEHPKTLWDFGCGG